MAGRFSVESVFKAVDRVTAPVRRMQTAVGRFTRAAERGLRTANRVLNATAKGFAKGAATMAKAGAAGVGLVAGAVALLVREFSKVEDAEAAFTPLLGGAEAARRAVQAINDAAATTPFQFETLASSVNQLLPVMNGNIERTIATVRMLGDTAGGNAQKLDSITRGFTKAMLKGKVDMESLNMIAEAGVPIFQDLAEVVGVDMGESFFKMISAGRVTTQHLTRAFEKLTSEGGKFYRGMEIASQTTTGLWSTLMDNISLTAAELGGVLAPTVKELIHQATTVAQRVREWVITNRALIQDRVDRFVARTAEYVRGLVDQLRRLNAEHDILATVVQLLRRMGQAAEFLARHGGTIAKTIGYVVALSVALKALAGVVWLVNLAMMANPIGLIVAAIGLLIAAVASVIVWWDELKAAFLRAPKWVQALISPLAALAANITGVKSSLASLAAYVGTALAGMVKAAAKYNPFSLMLYSVEALVQRVTSFDLGGMLAAKLRGLTDYMPDWMKEHLGIEAGRDDGDDGAAADTGQPWWEVPPQIVSPQERIARSISETTTVHRSEVTLRDETGRAEFTQGKPGYGVVLQPTGGF